MGIKNKQINQKLLREKIYYERFKSLNLTTARVSHKIKGCLLFVCDTITVEMWTEKGGA